MAPVSLKFPTAKLRRMVAANWRGCDVALRGSPDVCPRPGAARKIEDYYVFPIGSGFCAVGQSRTPTAMVAVNWRGREGDGGAAGRADPSQFDPQPTLRCAGARWASARATTILHSHPPEAPITIDQASAISLRLISIFNRLCACAVAPQKRTRCTCIGKV